MWLNFFKSSASFLIYQIFYQNITNAALFFDRHSCFHYVWGLWESEALQEKVYSLICLQKLLFG